MTGALKGSVEVALIFTLLFVVNLRSPAQEARGSEPSIGFVFVEQLPRAGTFYLLSACEQTHSLAPPYPAYVWRQSYPVYSFDGIIYVVDDLVGATDHDSILADALEDLSARIQNYLAEQQLTDWAEGSGMEGMETMDSEVPLPRFYGLPLCERMS